MLIPLRDELAEKLDGEAKSLFLGLVEGFHHEKNTWSIEANRAMGMPLEDIPSETLYAFVYYVRKFRSSMK